MVMKKEWKSVVFALTLALALAAFNAACSDKKSDTTDQNTGTVTLSGTVTGASQAPGAQAGAMAPAVADEVWAIPIAKMQGANIDAINVMLRETAALDDSGSFTFNLGKTITVEEVAAVYPDVTNEFPAGTTFDVDWLLVMMNGTTPVNVVELQGDTTYDGMISIPLSAFEPTSMNLGNVSSTDGAATLTVGGIESDVTLSSSSLAALARTDDILRTIKDIIRNCDTATNKCISAQQSFIFMGDYANIVDAASYDKASSYSGYQVPFYLTDYYDKTDFDGICPASGPVTIVYQLTPPGDVAVLVSGQTVTFDTANPWSSGTNTGTIQTTNDGLKCFKDTLYVGKSDASDDWMLQFLTGDTAEQLTTDMPAGDWVLSRSSDGGATFTQIATFEFALAKPVDDQGNPIVFVPAIRFDTDGTADNGLTTVHIKWYQHNGTDYAEVTDAALLDSLLGSFQFSMSDGNGVAPDNVQRYDSVMVESFDTASLDVSDLEGNGKFYYNYTGADKYRLDYVGISYQFGGQSFRFAWTNYLN